MDPVLYQQMRELEDRHWWFVGRRRIVSSVLQSLQLPAESSILDLGCGTGGNLHMLSQFGALTAVELDANAASLARARGVAPVLRGKLPDALPFAPQSFDLVTMLDVLEHIADDAATLQTVHRLLVPGGHLLLSVPAFAFLWGPHDEMHHHQRRYRRAPLRHLLEANGFRVRLLSYCNSWLFPPAALVRLLHRVLPLGGSNVELAMPPAPLNAVLANLFASERFVLPHLSLPFGISLLALVQKPGE
jgi:SAM-dependent methyltransferase